MKKAIKNCLAATGTALLLLAVVAILCGGRFICVETVFQVFAASIVIQMGFYLLRNFESRYAVIEVLAEFAMMLVILIPAGCLFDWYASTPLWILILLGAGVYGIGCMIDMYRISSDVNRINDRLKSRRAVDTIQQG